MIETRQIIEKIRIIPKDNTLYLLEKLPYETGLFASNGNVLYIVSNTENCSSLSIKTEVGHDALHAVLHRGLNENAHVVGILVHGEES